MKHISGKVFGGMLCGKEPEALRCRFSVFYGYIIALVGSFYKLILTKYYNKNRDYKIDLETKLDDLVETIYKTILFLMGSKIKNKEIKKK